MGKEYRINFKKTVWGYAYLEADSLKEAKQKFEEGEIDGEFDNKSEYEWEELKEDK